MSQSLPGRLNRIRLAALLAGIVGLGACFGGLAFGGGGLFSSYLFGCLFWLGLALGCLAVVMLHNLTGGRWGYPIRRFLEAGMATIPWLGLLFIPVLFGLRELYPWARPE